MYHRSRRGESLIELVVALVLLELAGAMALGAALTANRAQRHASEGAADDAARWTTYREAEVAMPCIVSATPLAMVLPLPATAIRPALMTSVRCGR